MKSNYVKKREQGFTIIEVLIVLAIAGLILLIVFLAVPALQRNNRNTQRKNEVSATIGAASEYVSNNNGRLPTTAGDFNAVFTGSNVNYRTYTSANVDYDYASAARTGALPTNTNVDSLVVYNYAACDSATNALVITGVSNRSIAALYAIEGSGGPVQQCIQS